MSSPSPPETRTRRRRPTSDAGVVIDPGTDLASRSAEPEPAACAGDGLFDRPVTEAHRRMASRRAVELLVPSLPPSQARLDPVIRYERMVRELLEFLDGFAGESYQQRWVSTQIDGPAGGSIESSLFARNAARARFRTAVHGVICGGLLRPSYDWLLTGRHARLHRLWRMHHDHATFDRIEQAVAGHDLTEFARAGIPIDLIRISAHTGKPLAGLSCRDVLDYREAVRRVRGPVHGVLPHTTYYVARAVGLFDDGPPELSSLLTARQRTPEEIVDHYGVANPQMRTLLIEYLAERRPSIDYPSFTVLAHQLCALFWRDIELAHPGIPDHRITREQAEAWRTRLATLPNGRPRRGAGDVVMSVRAFYLDINHLAHDHPERWAQWAAPAPFTRHEVRAANRDRRAELARMHARVRDVVPHLPDLVASASRRREHTAALLAAARDAVPGEPFELDTTTYIRQATAGASKEVIVTDPAGLQTEVRFAEHEGFWAWAMIEVLRHTGIRIEELLELTHHSIRPYRTPNGEIIPLLQIAPSKTDTERVVPASPELAHALAQIVSRVADPDGKIPLTSRRDEHERTWSDPQPHLFLNRVGARHRAFSSATLREYLTRALQRAGLPVDVGTRVTPHDFRRLFTTEAVNGGLPIHIAAAILGHQDLNTTMGYTAIYPDEVFRNHQRFIDRRRALRPTEEYQAPTAAELAEFSGHFSKRRIELGTCVRPYGSPCIHEHACLRCPFQQIDPAQLVQLDKIEHDIEERIAHARDNNWLGDLEQLQQTLQRLHHKRDLVLATSAAT